MSRVVVKSVWKAFGARSVLERISLVVDRGSFVTMVGASGCGKTTFLRILLGVETPTRGSITVDGAPLPHRARPRPGDRVPALLGVPAPHRAGQRHPRPGVRAEPEARAAVRGRAQEQARADATELLREVGLGHVLDAWPAALSGGMQQRLAIAQALILQPKILLLDEPFGALDPGIRNDMHELITRLWRETGMTVFMVTHDHRRGVQAGHARADLRSRAPRPAGARRFRRHDHL